MEVCKEPDLSKIKSFEAGQTVTLDWVLCASETEGVYTFEIDAEGLISGSMEPWKDYPAYDYLDAIGGSGSFTIEVAA